MPNVIIKKFEMLFLREQILKKYTDFIGSDCLEFEKELTGYIGHYERLADVIIEYISEEKNLELYFKFIKQGPLKIRLKNLEERIEDKRRYIRDLKSFVSENVLRKLIFYGPKNDQLTFKENFIIACYFYSHADRSLFLEKNITLILNEKKTIPPAAALENNSNKDTVYAFTQERGFSLQILKDNNEIDHSKKELQFKGEKIDLNRSTLDPENMTITSKIQAEINFKDGNFYLENRSLLQTTFLVVIKPCKISKGDIIVFGNKRFLFKEL